MGSPMETGEQTGTERADDEEAEAPATAAPRSASNVLHSPIADCLEPEDARLFAENFFMDTFFLLTGPETSGTADSGTSIIPDGEGETGQAGTLEQTAEKGIPSPVSAGTTTTSGPSLDTGRATDLGATSSAGPLYGARDLSRPRTSEPKPSHLELVNGAHNPPLRCCPSCRRHHVALGG